MTERGAGALRRSERTLGIGPSAVSWDDGALTVEIDEVAVPLPRRVRGRVRIMPAALTDGPVTLDAAGRHSWWPIAPSARIEASFERPALTWSGHGYVDSNWGSEPLEDGFASWHWSRTWTPEATTVLYDGIRRDGTVLALARRFDGAGQPEDCPPPSALTLPRTGWRIARRTRADDDRAARLVRTLEDTPFYARSLIATRIAGRSQTGVHESLSLDRFRSPIVQAMLPFRMPRRSG